MYIHRHISINVKSYEHIHISMDRFRVHFAGTRHISWKNQLFPLDVPSNQSIEHNTPASASPMRLEAAAFLAQLADSALYVGGLFSTRLSRSHPSFQWKIVHKDVKLYAHKKRMVSSCLF